MINFCIFEDDGFHQLEPLTTIKPAYCLQTGAARLIDRFIHYFNHGTISLHCRDYLKYELAKQVNGLAINQINTGSPCLFINGRLLINQDISELILSEDTSQNFLFTYQGQVVALFLRAEQLLKIKDILNTVPTSDVLIRHFRTYCKTKELEHCVLINHPWDLISAHAMALDSDYQKYPRKGLIKGHLASFTALYNDANMMIESGVTCEDFVVLDASKGPIIIESDVCIKAHSRLEGPLFIGEGSTIQTGTALSNASIGKHCKVGGEVHSTIMHPYSNKGHAGFCGHSVIGEWVNMGAGTTISNLKNTYSTIRIGTDKIDTGQQFCGAMIGDHVKLGIGTLINCGSRVGFGSSLVGTTVHRGDIPSFSWGEAAAYETQHLDKFLKTAERMAARRHIELTDRFSELIQLLHATSRSKSR